MVRIKKRYGKFIVSCITVMLMAVSIAGSYLTPVYANPGLKDETEAGQEIKDKQKDQEKAVLGGLLLVGLVSIMGKHGGDHKSSGGSNSNSSGGNDYIEPSVQQGASTTAKSGMTAEETQLVNLINSERIKRGLAALKINNAVADVARAHSQDMLANNYFDHYDLKGGSPFTRLSNAGIAYRTAGENIAINTSVQNAHTAFMNSAGHRANILNGEYTQVGVGIVHAGSRIWVTENFIG